MNTFKNIRNNNSGPGSSECSHDPPDLVLDSQEMDVSPKYRDIEVSDPYNYGGDRVKTMDRQTIYSESDHISNKPHFSMDEYLSQGIGINMDSDDMDCKTKDSVIEVTQGSIGNNGNMPKLLSEEYAYNRNKSHSDSFNWSARSEEHDVIRNRNPDDILSRGNSTDWDSFKLQVSDGSIPNAQPIHPVHPEQMNSLPLCDDLDNDAHNSISNDRLGQGNHLNRHKCAGALPFLGNDQSNVIKELNSYNDRLESQLMDEMIELVKNTINFRQYMYKLLSMHKVNKGNGKIDTEVLRGNTQTVVNLITSTLKRCITDVNNQLIALNYMKCLLNPNLKGFLTFTSNGEDLGLDVMEKKRGRKHIKSESSTTQTPMSNYKESIEDTTPTYSANRGYLISDPCNTLFSSLKCLEGQCSTTKEMFESSTLTECSSTNGCYLWPNIIKEDNAEDETKLTKIGCWTYDCNFIYEIVHQNKRHQFDSMLDFINDLCKVAVAEIRVPKPDWNEYCEFNCLNGYCCSKCCICKTPTTASKSSRKYNAYSDNDDYYSKFDMEMSLGRLELHKNILGACCCFCTCNTDNLSVIERIISDYSPYGITNDAISWYDVDSNNESDDTNRHIIQERFIIRVRTDSLPKTLKSRLPFTCRLNIRVDNSDLKNFDPNEVLDSNLRTPSSNGSDMDVILNSTNSQVSTILENIDHSSCDSNMETESVNLDDVSQSQIPNIKDKLLVRDFKHLDDFTFWDALDILKSEQNMLHSTLSNSKISDLCFDPLEIDISNIDVETLEIRSDSLIVDSKRDNYIEIALYLPYVPGNILPWEFENINVYDLLLYKRSIFKDKTPTEEREVLEDGRNITIPDTLIKNYIIVTSRFKYIFEFMKLWILMRNDVLYNERMMFKSYKKRWHKYIRSFKKSEDLDIFYWGILPVIAMDNPNMFVPLPAGFKQNDINYPYIINDVLSPHECKGFGIADLYPKKESFSQLKLISSRCSSSDKNSGNLSNRSKRDNLSLVRRKTIETEFVHSRSIDSTITPQNNWLSPSYSNLTGPSIRWTYSCMDTLNEPLHCIRDFKEIPIYKLLKCPELNSYTLDRMVRFDSNNVVTTDDIMEDELQYRVAGIWTRSECRIFVEKYLMYPKNFSKISQHLDSKKCSDCVDFYYRFKYRLKLKQRLKELKTRTKSKCDMARHLKREVFVSTSLDNIFDDCYTDGVKDFNSRNKIPFNTISDYLLRSGSLDSSQTYEVHLTQHRDEHTTHDDKFQYTLDNIAEGYFLPKKYLSLVLRKRLEYPLTVQEDEQANVAQRGCFILDYGNDSQMLQKSMVVALNTEYLFHSRAKTGKRISGTSIIDKVLYRCDHDGRYDDKSSVMYDKSDSLYLKSDAEDSMKFPVSSKNDVQDSMKFPVSSKNDLQDSMKFPVSSKNDLQDSNKLFQLPQETFITEDDSTESLASVNRTKRTRNGYDSIEVNGNIKGNHEEMRGSNSRKRPIGTMDDSNNTDI